MATGCASQLGDLVESSKNSKKLEMKNSFELGCHISPRSEPSMTDTTEYSTRSIGDDSFAYCRTNSETSAFSYPTDDNSCHEGSSPLGRPAMVKPRSLARLGMKQHSSLADEEQDDEDEDCTDPAVLDMMRERFSKLLLGEDMSGSGKGVCSAFAISNAITNLYATVFGNNLRLEPLPPEKKLMWRREMECLLSVCDYIVEFLPSADAFEDGRSVEVMTTKPRSDIYMNLPALQKLDNMLLQEVLESFRDTEFWYADKGSLSSSTMKSTSFRKVTQHKEEKWWLPVPCVPSGGLSEKARKQLQHKRDCANQIHKAAMAINNCILDDMEVPDSYMASLPKSGRASLGDLIYRYMNTSDKFCPDYVLDCVEINSEHEALEIADRVEASIYIWRRKVSMSTSKSSWNLMADGEKSEKNHILAGRAESLLLCLKQRYPELSQTTLATCKIQYNKDVGQAILESYSRVLEGLAYNLVSWIEDVLYVDSSSKRKDHKNP